MKRRHQESLGPELKPPFVAEVYSFQQVPFYMRYARAELFCILCILPSPPAVYCTSILRVAFEHQFSELHARYMCPTLFCFKHARALYVAKNNYRSRAYLLHCMRSNTRCYFNGTEFSYRMAHWCGRCAHVRPFPQLACLAPEIVQYLEQTLFFGEEETVESFHVAQLVPLIPARSMILAKRKHQFESTIIPGVNKLQRLVAGDTCTVDPSVFVKITPERQTEICTYAHGVRGLTLAENYPSSPEPYECQYTSLYC